MLNELLSKCEADVGYGQYAVNPPSIKRPRLQVPIRAPIGQTTIRA